MRKTVLVLMLLAIGNNVLIAQESKEDLINKIQKILKSAAGIKFNENNSVAEQAITDNSVKVTTTTYDKVMLTTTKHTYFYKNIVWDSLSKYDVNPTEENQEALWSVSTKVTLKSLEIFKGDKAKSLVEVTFKIKEKFGYDYFKDDKPSGNSAETKTNEFTVYCKIGDAYDFIALFSKLRKAK